MKTKLFQITISFLLIFFPLITSSQTPIIQWEKSLGGTSDVSFSYIQQTSDGGYVAIGHSFSNNGDITGHHGTTANCDYWIVKMNGNGNIQWQKSLGGTKNELHPLTYNYINLKFLEQTSDGGYIVGGSSESNDGDVLGHHGSTVGLDIWIVKLDSIGNIQWQNSLGGTSHDDFRTIKQTADGGYIVGGSSLSNDGDVTGNFGDVDYWLVKLNSAGTIQWQKSLGGSERDDLVMVQQTSDGGYLAGGISRSNNGNVTGHHGTISYFDYWIVKLDGNGNMLWQKSLGGTANEEIVSVKQTLDGGCIVGGIAYSNNGDITNYHGAGDYWIVKLDTSGNIQWQKTLGGSGYDEFYFIEQKTNGKYVLGGTTFSNNADVIGNHGGTDYWLVEINSNGVIQWQKTFGGSLGDYFCCIDKTSDGGYVMGGNSYSNDGDVSGHHGTTNADYWIVKVDSIGTMQWQKSLGGAKDEIIKNIKQTNNADFIVGGMSLSIDGDITGHHGTTGYGDYWVVKLSTISVGIKEGILSEIKVYPNPSNSSFTIQSPFEGTYVIINELGQVIQQVQLNNSNNYTIKIEELNAGIYFVVGYNNNQTVKEKIIITQ